MLIQNFYNSFQKNTSIFILKKFHDFDSKKMQIFIKFQKGFKDKLTFNDIHGQILK